jgi:hypothetical protein
MTPADFPLTFPLLTERHARQLEEAFDTMTRFEAEGVLLKVEYAGLNAVVSNALDDAWKKTVRERYTYAGKWEALSEAERKLEQSMFHPYPHTVSGYLKRATAATKAAGPMRDDMIALLTELTPLTERLLKLKAIIGKRAPKPTKTSIAQAERDAKAMTCQCCARRILAETGEIAHHGYQRPGTGWQTASCFGAKALPFEVDRARLGDMLVSLKAQRDTLIKALAEIEAETRPVSYTYSDRTDCTQSWHKGVPRTIRVTRETFDAEYDAIHDKRGARAVKPTFDMVKAGVLSGLGGEKRMVEGEIAFQQPRYDGWSQTHRWDDAGKGWIALPA